MKKLFSFILAVLMVVGMFPVSVFAETTPAITLTANKENIEIGEELEVTVALSNNPGFGAMTLKFKYDTNVLEFKGLKTVKVPVGSTEIEILDGLFASGSYEFNNGIVAFSNSGNVTNDGTLFVAVFEAKGDGNCNVSTDISEFKNIGGTDYISSTTVSPSATVNVKEPVVDVSGVTLDKTALELEVGGEAATLVATVAPENATDKTVTWSSSDESVAKVENGVVTAVAAGTATITAKAGEKEATCSVTVKEPVVDVSGVTLDKTALELEVGGEATLTATVLPEDATDKTVTWESSDAEVATVENGKVTAVKAGSATITAKAGEKEATCSVTVKEVVVAGPFTYAINDVPSNGDTWAKLESGTISGEVGGVVKHIWDDTNSLIVILDKSTPDAAVITSSFSVSGMRPSISGTGDVTLVNGTARQTIVLSSPFDTVGTWNILYTKDVAPTLADGQEKSVSGETVANENYIISLESVFTDKDGDTLSYQVKVNDGAYENVEGGSYTYSTAVAGEHTLTFRAFDGILYSEETYTVVLTVKNSSVTYDVSVTVPEGASPKFYAVNTVNDGTAVKGDELTYASSVVKVPENVSRIMWEADGVIGMSAPVSSGAKIELVKVTFEAKLYSGEADTEASIEIKDSEGAKITGSVTDTYLLPAVAGFTYKATAGSKNSANYHPAELTEQTPASGKIEIKLVLIHFSVIAPKGSVVSAGTLSGSFRYIFNEPLAVETEGENVIYRFAPLSAPRDGGAFIRVQRPDDPDAVTYWDYKSSKAEGQVITVTEEMLFMNDSGDDKFDSNTVYRNFEKYEYDLGDIYMNINNQGYVNLNVGDSKGLNMFRNWQAIESILNAKIALPDFDYEIINLEGNDVISITPDANNSAAATLTANSKGTAIVLVTYDAMYSDSTLKDNMSGSSGNGNRFSAIWPDRTGVFVVSVGKDGTAIKSNMTCNGAVFDAEHSPQFYVGDEGASVSFTPDEGVTVTVNRSTVGTKTLSFGEFTSEGVTVNSETGEVTVSGLKTGRHIIKFEKDGVASYQVVTAQQVTIDIVRSDGVKLGPDSTIAPGTALTLKIKGLTNPAEKFATKYNYNAQVTYKDEENNEYKNSSGTIYGSYNFSSQEQIINVTVPADWDGETMTLNGYIQMGGFSGGDIGDHRKVSYGTASGMAEGSDAGNVLGTLPELVINVGTISATSLTLDKTNIRIEADEPETITATILPKNSTEMVEWISADETIATVENGVVTGQSAGKTTITAKVGDLTATCIVEVYGTKKEINIETGASGNRYLSNIKITGVRGVVETTKGKAYTILLDYRTKTTDTINFEMTVNKGGNIYYFWVNNSKLKTSDKNPGTISVVPEWNENNEAVVTVRLANSSGGRKYDGPYTITFKIAEPPHTHNYTNENPDEKYLVSAADCENAAVYYKSCSICGLASTSATFEYGAVLGHDMAEAICTEPAKCKREGCEHTEGEALGHTSEGDKYVAATCTSKAKCGRCGEEYGNTAAHVYDKEVAEAKYLKSEATCIVRAVYYKSCVCGLASTSATFEYGDVLGHDWNVVSYSWSDDGKECIATRECKRDNCDESENTKATVTSKVVKKPNCTEKGQTEYTATFTVDWAETKTNTKVDIATVADSHDWDEGKVTTPATCSATGVKTYTCKHNSAHTKPETIAIDANAHDWKGVDGLLNVITTKEPTCTEKGERKFTCEHNADHYYTEEIDALGHEMGEWEVVEKPTYTKKGLMERVCVHNGCTVKETREIAKLVDKDGPSEGITIITPGGKSEEEENPNTGAPVFDLTAAGVIVLAATAAALEIKRRK